MWGGGGVAVNLGKVPQLRRIGLHGKPSGLQGGVRAEAATGTTINPIPIG